MTTVLYVTTGLDLGGAEVQLTQITKALKERGINQVVVCMRDWGILADLMQENGIIVDSLELTNKFGSIGALVKLSRMIYSLNPDVVQGWMYHGNIISALAHRCTPNRSNRSLYWNLRASDMDQERYGSILQWSAWLSTWPDIIIANSNKGAEFHLGLGFRPRDLRVVPNGIDTDLFRPDEAARCAVRQELGLEDRTVVALHVARVDPMKDHETFLGAMARVPDVVGLLVGSGTERLSTPGNVRALGLRRDVPRLYAAADLVVSSSAFGEGFSNALAEGMSAGLLPVATDVGDARLVVGGTGQIVPERSQESLAAAIAAMAELPRGERPRRGSLARARIIDHYSLSRADEAFAELCLNPPHRDPRNLPPDFATPSPAPSRTRTVASPLGRESGTISVIIPTFNRAALVVRAIRSVIDQDRPADEIIVVDDGSTDDTNDRLSVPEFAHVRVLRHKTNRGAAAARNTGIKAASGRWLAFLDSDDVWHPQKLSRQLAVLRNKAPRVAACTTAYRLEKEGRRILVRSKFGAGSFRRHILLGCTISPGSTLLVESSAFQKVGLFDERLMRLEDWEWLLRFSKTYDLAASPLPLVTVYVSTDPEQSVDEQHDPVIQAIERISGLHLDSLRHEGSRSWRPFQSTLLVERAARLYRRANLRKAIVSVLVSLWIYPFRNVEFFLSIWRAVSRM